MTDRPAAITVASHTRKIELSTRLPDETAWIMLLIPNGSTDKQVLSWAEQTLPADAVAELRDRIAADADGGDAT